MTRRTNTKSDNSKFRGKQIKKANDDSGRGASRFVDESGPGNAGRDDDNRSGLSVSGSSSTSSGFLTRSTATVNRVSEMRGISQ